MAWSASPAPAARSRPAAKIRPWPRSPVSGSQITVKGLAAGSTLVVVKDKVNTVNVPITVTSAGGGGGGTSTGAKYSLLAWNDLGMHCMDGRDYSVFSILPPFNNLHAQLVNASTGKAVTTGVTLTYEAVADTTGSINTSSVGKTNFWSWAKPLYGASPAADVGLTGNSTPSRPATEANTARLAAKPKAGWINDANIETD